MLFLWYTAKCETTAVCSRLFYSYRWLSRKTTDNGLPQENTLNESINASSGEESTVKVIKNLTGWKNFSQKCRNLILLRGFFREMVPVW
jgi:hypothetical protein